MKIFISLKKMQYGRGYDIILSSDDLNEKKLKRKINEAYKKGGWERIESDLENIRLPVEE